MKKKVDVPVKNVQNNTENDWGMRNLELVREAFQLLVREYRTILAYIGRPDIAPAAFSEATLHFHLQGGDNVLRIKSELVKRHQCVFDHDGRSAGDHLGVFDGGLNYLFEYLGNNAHVFLPGFFRFVNGKNDLQRRVFLPLFDLLLVAHVGRGAGSVKDREILVIIPVVDAILYE